MPTEMIGVPTSTVSPSSTRSADTVPANGDGSSTRDFAVSISTRTWLISITSPALDLPGDDLGLGEALTDIREQEFVNQPWCVLP